MSAPSVIVWLGHAPPVRSVRWLDGALATAATFGAATAVAAGDSGWLELAADRATRAGLPTAGIATELKLDYLGWGQVAAAAARTLGATSVLVDEASRPERFGEVAAIAEQLDAVQLTRVVALVRDGDVLHATRIAGLELQTVRVRGSAVIGVRIAGAPVDVHPTPAPATTLQRFDLAGLGLDAKVLGHRALPPRSHANAKKTVAQIAAHLAYHRVPRSS